MRPQPKSRALAAAGVIVLCAVACRWGDETEKANKLVNEGNAAIAEGNKLLQQADAQSDELLAAMNVSDFEASREQAKGKAQEVMDTFDKSAAKLREASRQFDDVSKLKIDGKFKEYLSLESRALSKQADLAEAAREQVRAVFDSSDPKTLQARVAEQKTRIDALDQEAKDLEAQAAKIEQDNQRIFKH